MVIPCVFLRGSAADVTSFVVHVTQQLFFRSNRRVCEEWLARIRPLLFEVAALGGRPTDVIRQVRHVAFG
jgi:hypothetical protein